jgi:uncharacterized protein YrrD
MQRNINSLIGFTMGATDGEIGKVEEFYFDDKTWTIRYLIVKTGSWLFGRKVLISPQAIVNHTWLDKVFPVNLSMDQIRNSPDIDTDKPVSRQQEMELYAHYPWMNYWGGAGSLYPGNDTLIGTPNLLIDEFMAEKNAGEEKVEGDPHLRSTEDITGYRIHASDGEIGYVDDLIIDEQSWKIAFLVVDTRKWLTGRKVLIAPKWIKEVQWEDSMIIADLSVDAIKNSPEFESFQVQDK